MSLTTKSSLHARILNILLLSLITFLIIYPFFYLLAISLSSSSAVLANKVNFLPVDFTTQAYGEIASEIRFWTGYRNTLIYTFLGTGIAVIITILAAYPLAQPNLPGRSLILKLFVFTMFFNGGLIPTYLVIKNLNMLDTIWSLLLPGAANAFYVIMMRTFFMGIPSSLAEAAKIDGLNQVNILLRIILPLSKPIIATIALFNAVWYYNDWFSALIYLTNERLYPVTMYLRNIMLGVMMAAQSGQSIDASSTQTVAQTLQAASTILVILPMLIIYPFAQKYFVRGVMVGSVKG